MEKQLLTDSHCHVCDDMYTQSPEEIVLEWFENNGGHLFIVGTNLMDSKIAVDVSSKYEKVHAIVGVHPLNVLKEAGNVSKVEDLAKTAVAVGEIGLDYHYEKETKRLQIEVFHKQMQIAQNLNLPVCIHTRDAMEDTLSVLKQYPNVKGVVHCYSGSKETAKELVKMGYYIGVGGIVTFKNAREIIETIKEVGVEHIVLETDSPYLSPEGFRGKCNKPFMVKYVANKVAEILNEDVDKILEITTKNAKKIYNIS